MADELKNYKIGDDPRTYQMTAEDAEAAGATKVNGPNRHPDEIQQKAVTAPANKAAAIPAAAAAAAPANK